jgi:hypothetical protein
MGQCHYNNAGQYYIRYPISLRWTELRSKISALSLTASVTGGNPSAEILSIRLPLEEGNFDENEPLSIDPPQQVR